MKRRQFVKAGLMGAVTASTATITAPVVAQDVHQWKPVTAPGTDFRWPRM